MYPIIGETEFRKYYDSLWNDSSFPPARNQSPLVDSIMAICMQYGSTFLISDDDMLSTDDVDHAKVASQNSYALYCRSQRLLLAVIENPSMMTLQSYIYCIIYLYNTSSLNAAYAMLGNASRVAQTIGLQFQPARITSVADQQLRARVWSVMTMLDSQLSMGLGRPATINGEQSSLGSPGHSQEHASLSGSMLMSPNHDDITWLSFHANCAQLVNSVQHIQYDFSKRVIQAQEQHAVKSFYDSPVALEELASFLGQEVRSVYKWAENVPESLKIPRKGSGESFSTERTLLKFDTFSPIWLQRQRLLLEIIYHHLQLSNFRSFLRLPPGSSFITPLSDCHSINCLNHAISLTKIINQVLTDTDLLRGWSPVIQYQWDSALCILGFTLTNPVCPPSPTARKCLQTAISSFEIMGKYFAASREAAQLLRRFASQAEMLVQQFHNNLSSRKLDSRDGSGQSVTPAARSSTTAAVQLLAAPALTPEYIQMCPSAGFDLSSFVGGSGIGGNESFTLDEFRNVSIGTIHGPSVLGGISGDLMSEVDFSWISGDGMID
ncbi:C6 transcription factor [Penicillium waksmanii]|uniref:C6 transcription factor n=1 Tax=Penicillium waksmanii TaxID=69791 RepID=UPI00254821C9|nr:C6 transcription factor [Penicillium waksmanii]KAJ5989586.1 C6 transcription factor [Penicillium waksmanii]